MSWNYSTIGEHCTVTSSKRFHLSDRSTTGVPFYCSKEIIQKVNGEEVSDCDYISEESYENIKKQFGAPKVGDLLITSRGTYGIPYIYRETDRFYFADGNLTWLKDFDDELYVKFLYYWILSYEGQKKIDSIAKGTAQKAVPIAAIKDLQFPFPPVDVQKRIAGILSAYDNLIENNQRQIKLLEEAAQRLYKEWFVDLRFPEHEHTPIIDGVPEGWEHGPAESFFNITIGKTPPRAESKWFVSGKEGVPWVSISDMGTAGTYVFDTAEELTKEAIEKHNVKVVPKGTILLSFKLTVGRVSISASKMCTNEAIAHFMVSDLQRSYTYLYLKSFEYDSLGNTSAISKAVNSKIIKAMPFVMPDRKTLTLFDNIATPLLQAIHAKQSQNRILVETRDRLLSKLMNGDLEVI